ncbi:MAG TPA: DUF2510 domain-containing protein [Polyangia bacterium]|nr:DUF2510 domain-containing protein [Polyangia bacterium]
MTQQQPPAGWYPDPHDPAQQRWWDGSQWAPQTQLTQAASPLPGSGSNVLPGATMPASSGAWTVPRATDGGWFRRHPVLSVIGAILIVIVIGAIANSGGSSSSGSPAATSALISTPPSVSPVSSPPPAPVPKTVLAERGNGEGQTREFTVSDEWSIHYSYNCASLGQPGNFQIYVYGTNNVPSLSNVGANEIGMRRSATIHNHHGGTYYLTINSECAWRLQVVSGA